MIQEAIDMYVRGEMWNLAKDTAAQMAPQYTNKKITLCGTASILSPPRFSKYVSTKYKEFLRKRGGVEDAKAVIVVSISESIG